MRRSFHRLTVAGVLAGGAAALAASATAAAAAPTGVWIDDKGRGGIEIRQCGSRLCGYVVWTKHREDRHGCGKQLIGDVANVGGGVWDNGWIFSPERGSKYSVELRQVSASKLKVVGYAGTKLFSQTMIWTRAPVDLERCDRPAQPKDKPIVAEAKPRGGAAAETTARAAREEGPRAARSTPPPVRGALDEPEARPTVTARAEPPPAIPDLPAAEPGSRQIDREEPDLVAPRPTPAERPDRAARDAEDQDRYAGEDRRGEREELAARSTGEEGMCTLRLPFVEIVIPCKKQ